MTPELVLTNAASSRLRPWSKARSSSAGPDARRRADEPAAGPRPRQRPAAAAGRAGHGQPGAAVLARPGVRWPADAAMLAHDAQVAARIRHGLDAIRRLQRRGERLGYLKTRSRCCAAPARRRAQGRPPAPPPPRARRPARGRAVRAAARQPRLVLVSFMDDTPGQRQWRRPRQVPPVPLRPWCPTRPPSRRWSGAGFPSSSLRGQAQGGAARPARGPRRGPRQPRRHHARHVAEARSMGVTISEFPTTLEAAEAARASGMGIVAGGPNLVIGGSHWATSRLPSWPAPACSTPFLRLRAGEPAPGRSRPLRLVPATLSPPSPATRPTSSPRRPRPDRPGARRPRAGARGSAARRRRERCGGRGCGWPEGPVSPPARARPPAVPGAPPPPHLRHRPRHRHLQRHRDAGRHAADDAPYVDPALAGRQSLGAGGVQQLLGRVARPHRRVRDVHHRQARRGDGVELLEPAAGAVEVERVDQDADLGPPDRLDDAYAPPPDPAPEFTGRTPAPGGGRTVPPGRSARRAGRPAAPGRDRRRPSARSGRPARRRRPGTARGRPRRSRA